MLKIGDPVMCIDDEFKPGMEFPVAKMVKRGTYYRITGTGLGRGSVGVTVDNADPSPYKSFCPSRFEKVEAASELFCEMLKDLLTEKVS